MVGRNRRGLIVEGEHDIIIYDKLLRKIGYIPKIRETRGNGRLIKKIHSWVGLLRRKGLSKIIALKDLHDKSIKEVVKKTQHFPNDVPLCLAIRTVEAWIIADEEALKQQFRKPRIRQVHNPENIEKPKEMLRNIFQRHGKSYVARRDLPKIIDALDLDRVRRKCPSFVIFENILRR